MSSIAHRLIRLVRHVHLLLALTLLFGVTGLFAPAASAASTKTFQFQTVDRIGAGGGSTSLALGGAGRPHSSYRDGSALPPALTYALDVPDITPPTITITAPQSSLSGATYTLHQVVYAAYACDDVGSGVASCVGTVANGEAIDTSSPGTKLFEVQATDKAGNGSGKGFTYRVVTPPDSTAPQITPTVNGALGGNGWYTGDVQVTWSVTDPDSPIGSTSGCDATTISSDTSGATLTCEATSAGGTSSESVMIKRDATAPTITYQSRTTPNGAGWNNAAVTVAWACGDATSGAVSASVSQTVRGEGANQSATGACADIAGNTASNTQTGINIDLTAPTLNPAVAPSPVALGGSATANPNASDTLSGVASTNCDSPDTSSVGTKTVSCTATDTAGNSASASASYRVGYVFSGFSQPVDNLPAVNSAKAGQAIPLKWRLTDASGNPVTTVTSVQVGVASLSCSTGAGASEIEEYATSASGLQNLGDGYYQYNWKTAKSYTGSCKTLLLDLGDGTVQRAAFQFK